MNKQLCTSAVVYGARGISVGDRGCGTLGRWLLRGREGLTASGGGGERDRFTQRFPWNKVKSREFPGGPVGEGSGVVTAVAQVAVVAGI